MLLFQFPGHILHVCYFLDYIPGRLDHLGLKPMGGRQDLQPFGNMEIHLSHRKLLQDALQDMENILLLELLAVYRQHRYPI